MVVDLTRLALACLRGFRAFPLTGMCKSMRLRFVLLESARVAARFERELSVESCLVAMSTARGDDMPWREPLSYPIKVLHRGAME